MPWLPGRSPDPAERRSPVQPETAHVILRDAAFPVLSATVTDIGGLEILLLRPDARYYDLLVPRSRAVTFWRWLTRRAGQFGYEVV